mgnify:CR=1 FL=1
MSMNPYDPAHRQIWDLIPWLVNGTLDDEQREIDAGGAGQHVVESFS